VEKSAMHWADVLANQLLEEKKKHVLATGITPSGPIHIGNMREILTTDAVYRSIIEKGGDADFIYIADTDNDMIRQDIPNGIKGCFFKFPEILDIFFRISR